jgi:hypothetical protein
MGEPLGDGATRREVGGKIIYGGGGGGGTPEKQTTVVDIPDWAKPYAKESLAKASALSDAPYQVYGGERIAQFSPLQQQAFGRAEGQQVAGQIGQATGLAGLASLQALNAGNYQPGAFDAMMASGPNLQQYQMGPAERVGTSSFAQPGAVSQYMDPYMQQVVQQQMDSAQRQADIAGTQRGAQAVRAGAFGGSRQAIENAEAARALASQKGQIQATGSQAAFQNAQAQFNQEQDARMRAAMANQQAGLTTGQANLQSLLGTQSLGAQTGMQAQLANQQMFMDAQRAAEQSRQFGSNLGLQGAQTALQGAGQLGQLGQQQFGQEMGITGQQAEFGAQQRAATQDILSQQYQDFLNQQRAPYDQLAFMTSMIRGTPMGQTTTMYQPPASQTSQLIGLGTAAAGAYGASQGKAAGGEVKSYAAGGIASLSQPEMAAMADGMSDQQLQQTQGLPSITDLARMTLAAEAQQRAQMRQAAMQQQAMMAQQPQMTVAEEQMAAIDAMDQGLGGLEVPDDLVGGESMAGGGIVAFAPGGGVDLEQQREEDRARIKAAYEAGLIGVEEFSRALLDIGTLPVRGIAGAYDSAVVRPMRAAGLDAGYLSPYLVPEGADPESMTPFYDQMRASSQERPATAEVETFPDGTPRGRGAGFTDPRLTQSGVNQSVAALQSAETQRKEVAGAGAGEKKQPGPPGISGGLGYLSQLDAERERQIKAQAEIDKLRAADVATSRGELSEEEKRAAEFGSEREKRLKAQEEKLAGSEKQNFNMTLIEAGLAMMAGESPNAFKNLAEGAARGLKGYQGRLQTLQDSREKLDESMARLAEIREEKISAVGARKRELNQQERSIMTESKAAQEKIASAFAGEKIKFTKDQADKASDRAFDVWKINRRDDQDSLANQRLDLSMLRERRILLQGQLAQAFKEGLEDEVARLRGELAGVDRALVAKSSTGGGATTGGNSGWGKAVVE